MGVISVAIAKYMGEMQRELARNIRSELKFIGIESVIRIRDNRTNWHDRSGCLRSSIGYAYYEHGKKLVESAFEQVGIGAEGTAKGRELVASIAQELASAYGLAVVAGMDYASYVEAKGHDVLASTELWVRGEIEKRIGKAIEDTIAHMNKQRI